MTNNTAVGCGQALQLFPGYMPNTDPYIQKFTAFQCGSFTFVKVCNTCHFHDINVIESPGTAFATKLTSPPTNTQNPYFKDFLAVAHRRKVAAPGSMAAVLYPNG